MFIFFHIFSVSVSLTFQYKSSIPFKGNRLFCRIYLNTGKTFLGRVLLQCRRTARPHRKHNALHTLWETCRGTNTFFVFLYPSHIYFIRCILQRLHGGRMAMCSDTHSLIHTHTHMRQDPRCPLVHVVILFFSSFFSSSFFIHPERNTRHPT